jgi:hypothetical protein
MIEFHCRREAQLLSTLCVSNTIEFGDEIRQYQAIKALENQQCQLATNFLWKDHVKVASHGHLRDKEIEREVALKTDCSSTKD